MKRILVGVFSLMLILTGCTQTSSKPTKPDLVLVPDLDSEGGADGYANAGDHSDSIYYKHPDFYSMTSNDTLTIMTQYQPTIQTTEWSCGPSSMLGALNHLGIKNISEADIATAMGSTGRGTGIGEMVKYFQGVKGINIFDTSYVADPSDDQIIPEGEKDAGNIPGKWSADSLYDGSFIAFLKENIKNQRIMLVEWVDWDGHWQSIIGYDSMGTDDVGDDVLIFADPYDTSDHWQDGYYTYSLERFFNMWNDRNVASTPYQLQQYVVIEKSK